MSCSVEDVEMAPTALQPGFSFAVAFEALYSRSASELRTKCSTRMTVEEGDKCCFVLRKQIREVERWRGSVGAMLCGYERRKSEEFARLREESESQALLARRHAEQQVESLQKLHAAEVHELYDVFMQVQPITKEFLASIQTRTSLQLREVVETQQQQIQELHASNFLSHLKEQSLEEETTRLKLDVLEKDDILASLKTEVDELIPKLHGYIDAREHLLTVTLKENTRDDLQKLELLLRNEQRENAWMQRALKENKRKRADRLTRLQKQVADLTATVAQKDDVIGMLEKGFRLKEPFPPCQPETTTIC